MVMYIRTGLIPDFPTFIVYGFTMAVAIQSYLPECDYRNNRQNFEMNLERVSDEKKELNTKEMEKR